MILIKSISYVEVAEDPIEVVVRQHPDQLVPITTEKGSEFCKVSEVRKLIRGRRFVRPADGKDVVIGCYPGVETILGLQYDAWENLEQSYESERGKALSILRLYNGLKKASLWSRVKWVFTGVK